MTIFRAASRREEYRLRAGQRDINALSGRTGRSDLTQFVMQNIIQLLHPSESDCVVDIGCGDGSLLRQLLRSGHRGRLIGILPSVEEVDRLSGDLTEGERANIEVRLGLATDTGLDPDAADTAVVNGVLLVLDESEIAAALSEVRRVLRGGGLLFVGEIPDRDELADRKYGDSISQWLWWVLTTQGWRPFARSVSKTAKGAATREPFIIAPKALWFSTPDQFVDMTEESGFTLVSKQRHAEVDSAGRVAESGTRWDYLFRRTE